MEVKELIKSEGILNYVGEMYKVKGTDKKEFLMEDIADYFECKLNQVKGFTARNKEILQEFIKKDKRGRLLVNVSGLFLLSLLMNSKSEICKKIYNRVNRAVCSNVKESQIQLKVSEDLCPIEMDITNETDEEIKEIEEKEIEENSDDNETEDFKEVNSLEDLIKLLTEKDGVTIKEVNRKTGESKDVEVKDFLNFMEGIAEHNEKTQKESGQPSFVNFLNDILPKSKEDDKNDSSLNIMDILNSLTYELYELLSFKIDSEMQKSVIERCKMYGLSDEIAQEIALELDDFSNLNELIKEYKENEIERQEESFDGRSSIMSEDELPHEIKMLLRCMS